MQSVPLSTNTCLRVKGKTFQRNQFPLHCQIYQPNCDCKIHEMFIRKYKCNPKMNAMFKDVNGSDDLFVMFAKSFLQNFLADSW